MICVAKPKSVKEQQLLKALEDSEKRYALAAQITNDGLWEWRSSNHVYYSPRWKSMVGCQADEIKNNPVEWLVRVHATDIEALKQNLSACWQGEISQFEIEYSLLHQDGEYRSMYCKCLAVRDANGSVNRLIGSQTDITRQKRIEAKLDHNADYDKLTDLPNRQLFIKKLQELSLLKQNPDYLFGILCLDIDAFKQINHNFGHVLGDRLLIEIVRRLKSCLRSQDLIARLGGDEFGILLAGFDCPNYPSAIASQIQQEFSLPIKVASHPILISVSIGVTSTLSSSDNYAANTLSDGSRWGTYNLIESLQNAELAMNQAKITRQCYCIFEPGIQLQNLEKCRFQNDLKQAIEQEQFELYYQPIVKLDDHQLIGFEALIRWHHPTKGIIAPSDFIPLAEATGLIMPIGWWVLHSACQQMATWQRQHPTQNPIFISVNITAQQFSQPYAGNIIAQVLAETGLDPRCLKLEITESEIIENIDAVIATAQQLKSLGIQLSMDDFGTGYSSLSYLHCLPVDSLKIDRSFIKDLESDRHKLELVKTIIKLAEVFNLDLIAEGIEREEQWSILLDLQCKYGQGYLFSQPLPAAEAATLLL